ncbi:hypothetical protein [Anoxybacter fermentans]|nr:hypothetical protein [Anoxybacter fermentans]
MKMIKVKCQGQTDKKCENAYKGCKERIIYSETDHQVFCKNGNLTIDE